MTYIHAGVTEWYSNSSGGLEQGFSVDRRPAGSGPLTLVVAGIPADERGSLANGGTAVSISGLHHDQDPLSYSKLRVTDRGGRRLPSRFEISGDRILVKVDDRGAHYPITIDPSVEVGGAKLSAPVSVQGGWFGMAVAISKDGSTVVVGAPGQSTAYVFTRPAGGSWEDATETAELRPSSDDVAGFGTSVAVSADGSTIAVASDGPTSVFSEPSTGAWQDATPTADLSGGGAESVAISGDGRTIVAGEPSGRLGSVEVYTEPASGGWQGTSQGVELTSSDTADDDGFGSTVAISQDGSTIVVGAPQHGSNDAGAVYLFAEPQSGEWVSATETAELDPGSDFSSEQFGSSVAVSGDGQIVVASSDVDAGQIYLYDEPEGEWTTGLPSAELTQAGGAGCGVCDVAISADGGTVLVGAGNTAFYSAMGAAYVYREPAEGGWQSETQTSVVEGAGPEGDAFNSADGASVAVSGDGSTSVIGNNDSSPVLVFAATAEPEPSAPPTISGTAVLGATLTEGHGTWTDNPTSYTYQWERCDTDGSACAPIAGATAQTYTVSAADIGQTIAVKEIAFNVVADAAGAVSAATSVVLPDPPAETEAPQVSGAAVEGGVLTASTGSWSNSPTTYTYQWLDCDAAGSACEPIAGATANAYTLTTRDIGYRVSVQVTAANAGGSESASASSSTPFVTGSGLSGFEIDDGDYATNNPRATIQATWPLGTQSILISNSDDFGTTATLSPAASIPWTLAQQGDHAALKIVFVRFLGVDRDTIDYTGQIILDEVAPTLARASLLGDGGKANSVAKSKLVKYRLLLRADDRATGICAFATNTRRDAVGEAVTSLTSCTQRGIPELSKTFELKAQTRPRFVRVRNSAGSWSSWKSLG